MSQSPPIILLLYEMKFASVENAAEYSHIYDDHLSWRAAQAVYSRGGTYRMCRFCQLELLPYILQLNLRKLT
jgi:hypothetical protein